MEIQRARALVVCGTALTLLACAGGGGGSSGGDEIKFVGSASPAPAPTKPLAPAHLGLVSSAPFAVLGIGDAYTTDASGNGAKASSAPSTQDVQFSFDASTNTYRIGLPGFEAGDLTSPGYSGSAGQIATSSFSQVSAGSSATLQPAHVFLFVPGSNFSPYTYTSFGSWDGTTGEGSDGRTNHIEGDFAYGIPTQAGDVPVIGSASYSAQIRGSIGAKFWLPVTGTANLSFDFGAGQLSGSMHPGIFDTFDGIIEDFGTYAFTQTVFSKGSTTFSGKFAVPGLPNADSSFNGNFTGPSAAELMARFQAPYVFNGQQGMMSGIWVGKKN
jgi:hypothetical protein